MKNLNILLFILLGLHINLLAQNYNVKIEGYIIGYDGLSEVNYAFSSLNYHVAYDGMEKIQPDSSGRFTILKNIDEVKFFSLIYDNDTTRHECSLIIQPDKNYSFISEGFNMWKGASEKDQSYLTRAYTPDIFSHATLENRMSMNMSYGQMYYNLIDNGTFGAIYRKDWNLMQPDSLFITLSNRINRQVQKFREQLEAGSIDEEFFQVAKLNVEYTQAYRLAQTIQDTWNFPNRFGVKDSIISDKLKNIYVQIFENYPVEGVKIEKVQGFPKYIDIYLHYLSCLENEKKTGQWHARNMTRIPADNIKNQLSHKAYKQYELMNILSATAGLKLHSSKKAKDFLKENPEVNNSLYGEMLSIHLIPRAELFDSLANKNPGNDIVFLDESAPVDNIEAMFNYFKGKAFLIDFWGTWCGSCRYQFKYNQQLKTFLEKNNIEMLYISKEYTTNRSDWKKVVNAYDLKGHHFLLNDSFKKSLEENHIQISGYPSYVVVNANGEMFKLENLYPSDEGDFFNKIKEVLK